MTMQITTTPLTGALLLAAAGSLSAEDCENYCIDWYNIDASGGVILSDDGRRKPGHP